MKKEENIAFYKDGKPRIRPCYCKPETDKKYDDMPCDYGWHTSERFIGVELPKKDKNGVIIKCGSFVKNKKVSGVVKFFEEPLEFRVQVKNCKYAKDINSIELFCPTKIGIDEATQWEVYTGEDDFDKWMTDFPKEKKDDQTF